MTPLSFDLPPQGLGRIFSGEVTESRSDKLWIPQDTQAQKDQEKYNTYFPREGGVSFLIAESKEPDGALTAAALNDLMALHTTIVGLESELGDKLVDLCVPSYSSYTLPCFTSNVLAAWDYTPSTLAPQSDAAALGSLNSYFTVDTLSTYLGGEKFTDATETSVKSASAIQIVYYLKSDIEVINNRYESFKVILKGPWTMA